MEYTWMDYVGVMIMDIMDMKPLLAWNKPYRPQNTVTKRHDSLEFTIFRDYWVVPNGKTNAAMAKSPG